MPVELTTCVVVVGLVVLFFLFFHYSRLGIAMRATAFNQKYALLMGVSVRKIFSLAWVFASVVASIGDLSSRDVHISPEMSYIGLEVFPAVILGGIDSIAGAMVGSLIIGVVENLAGDISPRFSDRGQGTFRLCHPDHHSHDQAHGLFGKEEVIGCKDMPSGYYQTHYRQDLKIFRPVSRNSGWPYWPGCSSCFRLSPDST
jgi:hypothetical protein